MPAKKAPKTSEIIEVRNGVTWYGKMVNYTTGAKLAFSSFPDSGKDQRPKWVRDLAAARLRGDFRPLPYDVAAYWAEYIKNAMFWQENKRKREERLAIEKAELEAREAALSEGL